MGKATVNGIPVEPFEQPPEVAGGGSIIEQERAGALHQEDLIAADMLRRSGMEDADPGRIQFIAEQLPKFGKLREVYQRHLSAIFEVQDDPDLSDEDRRTVYAEKWAALGQEAQSIAAGVKEEAKGQRVKLDRWLFGMEAIGAKNTNPQNYRDALYRAKGASDEDLAEIAELAEMTGDKTQLRAAAAIADRRGLKGIVHRYLGSTGRDSEKLTDVYTIRNMLPTDTTLDILVSRYTPRPISKDQLRESHIAKQRRKERETRQNYAKMAAFR